MLCVGFVALCGSLLLAPVSGGTSVDSSIVDREAPRLFDLRTYTPSPQKYEGDRKLLVTISPNGDKVRDVARIAFRLTERATVHLQIVTTVSKPVAVYERVATLGPGRHAFTWFPKPTTAARTYLTLLGVTDAANNRRTYGAGNAETGRRQTSPVIRVLGVDAGFTRESYVPGESATLRLETDAPTLSLQVFRAGPEDVPTYNDTLMNGVPASDPVTVAWTSRDRPGELPVPISETWPSGLYFAKLTADDGRIGFAPFVVRPAQLGSTRVAVIIPTNTWQAYNFRDEDGNGWGDTWYAKGAGSTVTLGRPFLRRGVPPQYRKYDLGFIRWLAQSGKQPDYLSETDLELLNGDALAGRYDLIVFPGHTEYVTRREYDAVERFRDLGGNLMFLSADNFFWQVQRQGQTLTRTRKWRDLGRPESALIGVQYRGNDDGRMQRPFIVRAADTEPWLFAGTDLSNGATLGQELGGYGIEIDGTTAMSPPGTRVIAEIPDLFGPGFTAQMTYYETPTGAKVFAAGAVDFGGTALLPAVSRMLSNLWARLSVP